MKAAATPGVEGREEGKEGRAERKKNKEELYKEGL
jgi:hypothetical protein